MRKSKSMENKSGEAKVQKVRNWSPVWIFPIVTALIGAWILFYHYSHQGTEVTLITTNAEGIEGGKTTIKSRSVDVGVVATKAPSQQTISCWIHRRLRHRMQKGSALFWTAKKRASSRRAIRYCSVGIASVRLKQAPSIRKNGPSAISFLSMRLMIAW